MNEDPDRWLNESPFLVEDGQIKRAEEIAENTAEMTAGEVFRDALNRGLKSNPSLDN
jgi:hypothetical protein